MDAILVNQGCTAVPYFPPPRIFYLPGAGDFFPHTYIEVHEAMKEYVVIFDDEKDTVCASWDEAVSHTYSIISAFLSSSSSGNAFAKYADCDACVVCHDEGIVCYATLYESLMLDDIFNTEYDAYPIYIQYRDVGSIGINDIVVWDDL